MLNEAVQHWWPHNLILDGLIQLDSIIQHRQIIVEFKNDTRNIEFYNNLPILDEAVYVG